MEQLASIVCFFKISFEDNDGIRLLSIYLSFIFETYLLRKCSITTIKRSLLRRLSVMFKKGTMFSQLSTKDNKDYFVLVFVCTANDAILVFLCMHYLAGKN